MSRRLLLSATAFLSFTSLAFASDWPQWRGPAGDGTSSDTNVPLKWGENDTVAWKCPLPDGASTPATWGDAVFVTAQDGDKLMLFRIDRETGKVVWSRQVGAGRLPQSIPEARPGFPKHNKLYSLAAPSPVVDGEVVVAHFGNGDLAAFDFSGKELWKHNLQAEHGPYTVWWGHANSPVLVDDLVINVCMQDSLSDLPNKKPADSYLVAYDKRTGAQGWKTLRNTGAPREEADSYTTPLLRTVNGRRELVVMGGNQLDAYDPMTGKQLWYLPDLVGGRTVTGPTIGGGRIFATRGKTAPVLAVSAAGSGRLERANVAWENGKGTADSSSLVYHDGLLFWITDSGVANCVDAATGKPRWMERFAKGNYKASPIVAAGRVYFLAVDGRCVVVAATGTFEKLAENTIQDETVASPAVADNRLYIRGRKALYCIR